MKDYMLSILFSMLLHNRVDTCSIMCKDDSRETKRLSFHCISRSAPYWIQRMSPLLFFFIQPFDVFWFFREAFSISLASANRSNPIYQAVSGQAQERCKNGQKKFGSLGWRKASKAERQFQVPNHVLGQHHCVCQYRQWSHTNNHSWNKILQTAWIPSALVYLL